MSPSKSEQEFESLLEYLKRNRGFDFTGYKRPSLERRIEKRMAAARVDGFAEYVDFLEVHPEEFSALFNTILINVTSFFRDDGAWTYLAESVLPELIERKGASGLRVWSAGCASGEEAYTLVMLLAERMGDDGLTNRVKIYATDLDDDALGKARNATYSEREVADVPARLLKKYFERVNTHFVFRKALRRQVVFGRHDLITDAPISRVDLLVCRNTLMYMNAETQGKILARFHFAMNDGGVLFLGRAETLLTHASTFQPIDLKRRISKKVPRTHLNLRDKLLLMAQNGGDETNNGITQHFRLRDVAMDAAPVAQLVVDTSGTLILANDRARSIFLIAATDVGRSLHDLKISYRPVELRSMIEQANAEQKPVIVRDVEWQPSPGDARWLDLHVVPLFDAGTHLGTSVTFTDVSLAKRTQRELAEVRQELGTAYEELQSTNEELETTNEELQSTVEELETTNEELQSTNEELETMNEELQSTNEELHTINDELSRRSEELNQVNSFLEMVLTSVRGGVVVVDKDLSVLVWSRRSQDMWGLREDEVTGKHLLGLDIGLPISELRQPIKACLSNSREHAEVELDATNRRGKPMRCRVSLNRLTAPDGQTRGCILVMDEIREQPILKLAES